MGWFPALAGASLFPITKSSFQVLDAKLRGSNLPRVSCRSLLWVGISRPRAR